MINILSYVGLSLQSEVCLWTILGLVRIIFDATLFKVNANLKQVWQMSMPEELSLHVQRVLRTMISSVMLVQCFTVYVYLASYIVLLYPAFLEDRPTLVFPWLLLAAIRQLLCELTSLALGLGICLLLGAARPPCIKFVVIKVVSIMPSFYMWMLVYSYYHALKVATVFKTFPAVIPRSEHDYGLELAVRRRRTKSLLGEEELRKGLIATFYNNQCVMGNTDKKPKPDYSSRMRMSHGTDTGSEDLTENFNSVPPLVTPSSRLMSDTPMCYEDWFGSEVVIPRDTDRILEQFGVMMLRISAYLRMEKTIDFEEFQLKNSQSEGKLPDDSLLENRRCTALPPDDMDTPPLVGSSNARTASYLRDYPQIFSKKTADIPLKSLSFETNLEKNPIESSHAFNNERSNSDKVSLDKFDDGEEKATTSQKIYNRETMKKREESDKSPTFVTKSVKKTTKPKSTSAKHKDVKTKISDTICSLESILNDINTHTSTNELSLEKDKNNYETKGSNKSDINIDKSFTLSVVKSNEDSNTSSSSDMVSNSIPENKNLKENEK